MIAKNFFKIFATIFFSTCILFSPIAGAEKNVAWTYDVINPQVMGYVEKLPVKTGNYKNRQRPILIQGAMTSEVGELIKALEKPVVYWHMHYLFVAGTYKDYPVVISRTEIGMENAAASTVLAIEKFNPIAIINQGTAGGYDPALHLNDIVIGEKSINCSAYIEDYMPAGEYDVTKKKLRGIPAYTGIYEFVRVPEFAADEKLLKIAKRAALDKNFNVTVGTIGSADSWHNSVDHINFLHEKYGIDCEEMETNSAAQMCYTAGVPFIGVRVISDNALTGEKFELSTAADSQNFSLLVAEKLIREIKLGRFS